jgi:rare lipoprotein A
MKKFLVSLTLLIASCGIVKADGAFDSWNAFSHKAEHHESEPKQRKSKSTRTVESTGYNGGESGMASYYWQPQAVACGGRFNPNALTAAHKTLPCGSRVTVTNRNNNKSVTVTINDRGPFVPGRIIDLSKAAAIAISMTGSGVAPVTLSRN